MLIKIKNLEKWFISKTQVRTVSSQRNLEEDSFSTPPRTSHLVSYPKPGQAGHPFASARNWFLYKPVSLAICPLGSSALLCSLFLALCSWLQVGFTLGLFAFIAFFFLSSLSSLASTSYDLGESGPFQVALVVLFLKWTTETSPLPYCEMIMSSFSFIRIPMKEKEDFYSSKSILQLLHKFQAFLDTVQITIYFTHKPKVNQIFKKIIMKEVIIGGLEYQPQQPLRAHNRTSTASENQTNGVWG